MPSFYGAGVPASHMPPYTPEYALKYNCNGYGGMQEQRNPYGTSAGVGPLDLSAYGSEPFDQCKAVAPPSATLFPSSNLFANNAPTNPIVGAPVSRPVRESRHSETDRHRHGPTTSQRQPKEEQVVGGVSAKLDYEMETMTDFVAETSSGMYALYTPAICLTDVDFLGSIKAGCKVHPNFRKWVLHVLNATRLPSATILTSLHYLSLRVHNLSANGHFAPSEATLYQLLTVALILGSKFLDDNTFQNKSWAEVSQIKVTDLNRDEREWLAAFDHRLHYHPQCHEGFQYWQDRWIKFQVPVADILSTLRPLDTNVQRQQSMRQVYTRQSSSPSGYPKQYPQAPQSIMEPNIDSHYSTPTYTPYDPWFPQRTALDRSPSSAPHTGPTTPEYYGAPGIWSQDYSQRAQFAYPAMSVPQLTAYHAPYNMPLINQFSWTGHGPNCDCVYCPNHVPHYMMPGRYGPSVAG